ncbi:zinc finger protein 771-like [Thrips palmi]|uniref:Zinc finger protein 771-like n=1 Tax=Thrips palmi TaxID=161013 RepID=A0A6P8ZX63_THRPL|nr:zinc finger protein 771-like [Thrips palmi]
MPPPAMLHPGMMPQGMLPQGMLPQGMLAPSAPMGVRPAGEGWFVRRVSPVKEVFVCSDCGNEYLHYASVHKHRRFECGKEPQFQCSLCPHRTKLKSNLTKHLRNSHNWTP